MYYRKEIDGLRAIAILPVIWTHSGLPYFSGGFIGVDVFFVISGFLITAILLKDFETESFSLSVFYERRARRILPALVIVIMVTSLFVPMVSDNPKYISDYGESVLSSMFFASNIYFWQTSGYFGSASEISPMLHTWSLAVEEQYYIFFPILLLLIYSFGKKTIITTIVFILICSLLTSEWGAVNSPDANFYLLPSRVWELMAGGLAAVLYSNSYLVKMREHFSAYLSLLGLIFILLAYLLFTPSTSHPTSITIIPVLGAVLILLFAHSDNLTGKILSIKPFSFIGLISYSLYLWHQPVLALIKKEYSIHLGPVHIVSAILFIFILSYLTWKYIETPFRNKNKYKQDNIFKLSIISILVVSFGSLIFKENLIIRKTFHPEQMSRFETILQAEQSHSNQIMFNSDCRFWSKEFNEEFVKRFEKCAQKHNKAIFILGGSHGMDLYNAIAINSPERFVVSVSRGFCRAHERIAVLRSPPKCQYQDFKKFAKKYANNISYVLYTQTPDRLFNIQDLDTGRVTDLSMKRLNEVVKYLVELKQDYNLNVIMIGMLPPLNISPINWDYQKTIEEQFNVIVSKNSIVLTKYVDEIFTANLKKHEIPYFSKFDAFQLSLPTDLIDEGVITYSDNRHLSNKGEELFGARLVNYLSTKGYREFKKITN